MNFLKVVGIGCLGCLGLIVVLGIVGVMLLPDGYEVTRSIEIAAPPAAVFPLVDTPSRWSEWDPWTRIDPAMTNTYSGPESGVGATRTWDSENTDVGKGTFTIVESVPSTRVALDLEVPEVQMSPRATFTFEPTASGTRVTWTNADDLEGGYRAFGLVADAVMGPMFEDGLRTLKVVAEREATAASAETAVGEVEKTAEDAPDPGGVDESDN